MQIGGSTGTYSTTKSGLDIIVTTDNGKSLEAVNIAGKEDEKDSWKLSGTTATYGIKSKTLATVNGVRSAKRLTLNGETIQLATNSLSSKVTVGSDRLRI